MKIREIKARSIITPSGLPDADYVINPYTGCTHACIYCYACFMRRFTGHTEPWGQFLDVKINAPQLIPEKTTRLAGKSVFLASVTDPYLPHERKYRLTRRILEKLLPLKPQLQIQTKSDLITRDLDLLREFNNVEAGLTVTTLDDAVRREIEPGTASVEQRITALEKLAAAGIRTHIFIGPLLPYLTDWQAIIRRTHSFCSRYFFENLNLRGSVHKTVKNWLAARHPGLARDFLAVFTRGNAFWQEKEREIRQYCCSRDINHRMYFHHRTQKG